MAELVLRLRDREMARAGIQKSSMTIGRDASCDLVIDNAAVSRIHAVVSFSDLSFRVRDEDSENGITVNGKRVRKAAIDIGDVIGIGKFEIQLVDSHHEIMREVAAPSKDASKNVMKTMQVDATTAARLRDEAMARIAAQKGLPAPAPSAPPRTAGPSVSSSRPVSSRAPAPEPAPVTTGIGGVKLLGLVVFAVIVGGVLVALLMR